MKFLLASSVRAIRVFGWLAAASRLAAQSVLVVPLSQSNATLREEFSALSESALRELQDSRVPITPACESDSSTSPLADNAISPGLEFATPGGIAMRCTSSPSLNRIASNAATAAPESPFALISGVGALAAHNKPRRVSTTIPKIPPTVGCSPRRSGDERPSATTASTLR